MKVWGANAPLTLFRETTVVKLAVARVGNFLRWNETSADLDPAR